jgi:hypothetical protein
VSAVRSGGAEGPLWVLLDFGELYAALIASVYVCAYVLRRLESCTHACVCVFVCHYGHISHQSVVRVNA